MQKKLYHSGIDRISLVARDTYVLTFKNPEMSRQVAAGQFVEIKIPHCAEILWRRPFSIHDVDINKGLVHILFHAIGRGTQTLTLLKQSEKLEILGPLGNQFKYDSQLEEAIIVAGGLGIAPFMLMKRELETHGIPMRLFYGVGTADQFCGLDQFNEYAQIHLSTMDGSRGFHGLVTDMLVEYLQDCSHFINKALFVCGPTPMLHAVQLIVEKYNIPAQVSVETIMACGFGACVGCAVPMTHPIPGKKEYYLACKDGPVFDMNEITIND